MWQPSVHKQTIRSYLEYNQVSGPAWEAAAHLQDGE